MLSFGKNNSTDCLIFTFYSTILAFYVTNKKNYFAGVIFIFLYSIGP